MSGLMAGCAKTGKSYWNNNLAVLVKIPWIWAYYPKLTLDRLSAKVSMSPQHLSEIKSGKRDPRLSSIKRMAEGRMTWPLLAQLGRRRSA
jgi:hypothetical protein